ncbi:MAG TPA: hypothetical protein VFD82_12510 [Planctomycetota bacterium]|nr:hypothetical protein [Planctomycetota bacterium]
MNVLLRLTLAIALAVWIACPVVNGMGEGGGGGGVWVLPRAMQFSSAVGPQPGTAPRSTLAFANASQDIRLVVSEMSTGVATLTEESSSTSTSLAVVGAEVVIPSALQQALVSSSCALATIVIVDAHQVGYYIQLVVQSGTGGFELRVF